MNLQMYVPNSTDSQWPSLTMAEARSHLATKLRVCSVAQLAQITFPDAREPLRAARQAFRRDVSRGLLAVQEGLARPEIEIVTPLFVREPGDEPTSELAGRLSYQARRRWTEPLTRVAYVTSTAGFRPTPGRPAELTHDLHIGQLYWRTLARDPERAARWKLEDEVSLTPSGRRPDAVIESDDVPTYVDFLGAYSTGKIAALLRDPAFLRVRLELW